MIGEHRRDRRTIVVERTAELPQRVASATRAGGGDRDLQRPHLVGLELEVGELVAAAVDPVAGLSGQLGALVDDRVDRNLDRPQRRLVAFERLAERGVGSRVLPVELGDDLGQRERLDRLEEESEEVRQPLDPVRHRRHDRPTVTWLGPGENTVPAVEFAA